jgi:beta-lactamase class A
MDRLSRRNVLASGLTCVALAALSAPLARAEQAPAVEQLDELERRHNALVGLYAVDLQTGRTLAHRENERFAVCSTFKAYLAARTLQAAQRGELAMTDTVTVRAEDLLPNSPVTETRVGQPITLAELCAAVLQVSDNAGANYLLHQIGGPPAITEFARGIGDQETRLDRWETELNSAVPGDPRDTSTPVALGNGFRALITGDALPPQARTQLVEWMTANTTSSLRPGLPAGWTFADKTGSGDYGTTNDIGVAFGPDGRAVLLSVMLRSASDDPDAEGLRPVMPEIATLVLQNL